MPRVVDGRKRPKVVKEHLAVPQAAVNEDGLPAVGVGGSVEVASPGEGRIPGPDLHRHLFPPIRSDVEPLHVVQRTARQ